MVRSNKAEVKYNVTTDFPHLGLHSAAASGDVGLVKYALSHGQPINSVLDGVLPLHAACSGGNDLVVRLLIDHGADVNAPRLPRRYSNDKHRDTSAPKVGTSGSTPLHFAAANGHNTVVSTLLLHGAHADRPDKHGTTPEMLARQNGWLECADMLRDWLQNKDKDLKEREILPAFLSNGSQDGTIRMRLHVQRSIDNALNKLKCDATPKIPLPRSPSPSIRCQLEPPSPSLPIADDASFLTLEPVSDLKLASSQTTIASPSTAPSLLPRPRSAGTGADTTRNMSPTNKRLGTKYSLLHMFRKAQTTGEDTATSADSDMQQHTSTSTSPPNSGNTSPIDPSQSVLLSSSLGGGISTSSSAPLDSSSSPRPFSPDGVLPAAVDKHRAKVQNHHRVHSSSGISGHGETGDHQHPSTSPRNHSRSSSQSQSQPQHTPLRYTPRSDSATTLHGIRPSPTYLTQPVDSSSRSSPLSRLKPSRSAQSLQRVLAIMAMTSATHPAASELHRTNTPGDDDEEEYGVPVEHSRFTGESANEYHAEALLRERTISSSSSSISQGVVGDRSDISSLVKVDEQLLSVPLHTGRADSQRTRGDSISSMSTNGSTVPQMTSSSTSSASKSSVNPTPGSDETYPLPTTKPNEATLPEPVDDHTISPYRAHLVPRRPLDIDIRSISSHAQAEALVQRAQHAILDMTDELNADPSSPGPSTGRTPLSARLAAYGESLAIQRMLRQEEEKRATASLEEFDEDEEDLAPSQPSAGLTYSRFEDVGHYGHVRKPSSPLDRKLSLERKSSIGSHARPKHVPKRPSTSAGVRSDLAIVTHRPQSRSVSSAEGPIPSSLWMPDHDSPEVTPVDEETLCHVINIPTLDPAAHHDAVSSDKGRSGHGRTRQHSSANKLTRMGFANPDGRMHGAAHGSLPRSVSGNKVMFGGLKTLMQSFKGRP